MNAVEILDRINTERKEKRAELWKEIQTRSPIIAERMQGLRERFGRVTLNWVKFKEEEKHD